jgi:hypothetical protein
MDLKIKINKYIMNEESSNKNKKYYTYDEQNDYDSNSENIYLNDNDEEKFEEYFDDTLYIIHTNLINFVENKSLPLCEYLNTKSIKKFIIDNIEY